MKGKISAFFVMIMLMLLVTGCGGKGEKEDDSIALTMDNYQQYLNVSSSWNLTGSEEGLFKNVCPEQTKDGRTSWSWKKEIGYRASVKGASTNFNYDDVVVVLKVSGTYDTFDMEYGEYGKWVREEDNPIDLTMEITTNIAGEGDDFQTISSSRWIHENLVNSTIEVVSVSGTVTPVK